MYYDHDTSSWRIPQAYLFEEQPKFSGTWPRAGLMLNGRVYRLPLWVRLIKDGEYWLLLIGSRVMWRFLRLCATPRPCTGKRSSGANRTEIYQYLVPTPRESDGTHGGSRVTPTKARNGGNLVEAMSLIMHPTPTANDFQDSDQERLLERREKLRKEKKNGSGFGLTLANHMMLMHPTPDANCWKEGERGNGTGGGEQLSGDLMARMYPSPIADSRDNSGGSNSRRTAKANGTYFGRTLNPEYVEWLQGFPRGWTDLDA